jgi:integrase
MRVGEVLELRWGDVILEAGREALRVREAKNGLERTVILGPTATPRRLRGLRAARRALGRIPADHDICPVATAARLCPRMPPCP